MEKQYFPAPLDDIEVFTREEIAMFEEMMVNARLGHGIPLGDYLTQRHNINQEIVKEMEKRNEFTEFWIK